MADEYPADIVMAAEDMVDAAMKSPVPGETITIPDLPENVTGSSGAVRRECPMAQQFAH